MWIPNFFVRTLHVGLYFSTPNPDQGTIHVMLQFFTQKPHPRAAHVSPPRTSEKCGIGISYLLTRSRWLEIEFQCQMGLVFKPGIL